MTPEEWRRLGAIFESALAIPPADRAAFLDRACGEDAALRGELLSLLRAHERSAGFLEGPAAAHVSSPAPTAPLPAGRFLDRGSRLGPYEIEDLLGAGGMGEVYRARDPRLGREVAVKVLREAAPSGDALRRFDQEARAAGALSHPSLLAVYDVGAEAGVPYVVTELLAGETLRQRLGAGALPVEECLELARQILSGLAAAHDQGILHRDLKPENLFLTADGRLKILDFGLAKRVEENPGDSLTRTGTLLGSPGYTAPEQLRGQVAGPASDLFAFGAVFYEMLTGARAFDGDAAVERIAATLTAEPPPVETLRPEAPAAAALVVARCLAKRPEERFASARAVAAALSAPPPAAAPGLPRQRRRSLAVLPFRDLAGDPATAHLGLGLADAVITELAALRSLVVRPTSAILRYQGVSADAQEAGRELGVEAVVEGGFQRDGARLRVTVQVLGTADGRALWAAKLDAPVDDLFAVQDEVSRNVARALEAGLLPAAGERRGAGGRPAGRAYDHYLRGRAHFLRETLEDFIAAGDWFEKARDEEPGFALAWAGLADVYARIAYDFQPQGNWYERAQAACERALTLEPGLPEGLYARARLQWSPQGGWNVEGALRDLMAAIAGRPGLDDAHLRVGVILYHVGLVPEAVARLERVLELSPEHLLGRYHLAYCRYHEGRFAEALAESQIVAGKAAARWIFYQCATCHLRLGHLDEAAAITNQLLQATSGSAIRALLAALRGDRAELRREIAVTEEHKQAYGHYHHAQYEVACALAIAGEVEEAIDWLEAAAGNGYPCVTFFESDSYLETLRAHERCRRLFADLRAQRDGYAALYRELEQTGQRQARR